MSRLPRSGATRKAVITMPKRRRLNHLLVRINPHTIEPYPILAVTEEGVITSQDNLACVRLTPGYLDEHLCYINSVRQQLAYPYASAWKNLARRIR